MTGGMPMRPGDYHIMIITGDLWAKAVQLWTPGYGINPADLVKGDRIFYEGRPERVYSVTPSGNVVKIMLRDGFIGDPWFTIGEDQQVRAAILEPVTNAEAAWLFVGDVAAPVDQTKQYIPTSINADGCTIEMIMFEEDTLALEGFEGAWKWDLHAEVRGRWVCILAGTMIIERSVARMV